jgi:hypothetical protein
LILRTGQRQPLPLRPSQASDFKHGFASLARFFPEGKSLMAKVEEELWDELYGLGSTSSPLVFDDQYIATGGQIYELLIGHDRMLGDLRPFALKKLGFDSAWFVTLTTSARRCCCRRQAACRSPGWDAAGRNAGHDFSCRMDGLCQ